MVGAPSLAVDVARTYRISLQRSGDGAAATWLADVDELPNCTGRGATAEEALRRAWAAANDATGLSETPTESVVPTTGARHSGRLLVRMPATLHDELARAATMEGVSLNQLITGTLAAAMRWRVPIGNAMTTATSQIAGAEPSRSDGRGLSPRAIGLALVANAVVLVIAAIAAIALVIVAWQTR